MGKKLNYNYIKKAFEKRGYTLLSKDYVNAYVKLRYECPNKHTHDIAWRHFINGHGCPYCGKVVKPTINEIEEYFKKEFYILLTKEYINNKTKLDYICSNGHKHNITWNSFKNGVRCPYCANNGIPDISAIKSIFLEAGYKLITRSYKNARTKLKSICKVGHVHYTTWNAFQQGRRCKECYDLSKFGTGNPSWKGGKSFEPYCPIWKDTDYKESIKERDKYLCQNPYCFKTDNVLHVHHINYDKKNCQPNNLITVCRSCNARANTDRAWHTEWYQTIINKKFYYIY